MATKISTLDAPEEQVSAAEDVKNVTIETPQEDPQPIVNENVEPQIESPAAVDFTNENASLDAHNAGLDLVDECADECEDHHHSVASYTNEDIAQMNKPQLIEAFESALANKPVQQLRSDVEALKIAFYKLHRTDTDSAYKRYLDAGGVEGEFTPEPDHFELKFKELFKQYRTSRDEFMANSEHEKEQNLKQKLDIIEKLKELINGDETLNHTFATFHDLQQQWREVGLVPQANVKDLWETYNHYIEIFYNYIKINKELRDLDLKKNYTQKCGLCESAEALILEPSIVEAFHKLQKLHDEWREVGPVANEFKESLWERFKDASSRINKLHQEHFDRLKGEQTKNLELKSALCDLVEQITQSPITSRKEWVKASEQLLEVQKSWKAIGFAPKKDNNRIYERFRAACDKFFEAKRDFFASARSEMDQNLELKVEICEAAEALMNNTDWKKSTDEILALQAKWKSVGSVSRRHSDNIWRRFRAACDHFFEQKSKHFASIEGDYEQNLAAKKALLEGVNMEEITKTGFEAIKEFQRKWSEIGFVPIKHKETIQKQYKELVDKMFTLVRGGERERSVGRFKERIASMKQGGGERKMRSEREKLFNKVRQLEQDIALLENNIGFFANSKGADAMIADVREKISRARQEMALTIEKVKLIDSQNE